MLKICFFLLGVLTATAAPAAKKTKGQLTTVAFRCEGKSQLAVLEADKVDGTPSVFERTRSIVPQGHNFVTPATKGRSFVLRTQDFKFKMLVDISENDKPDHPFIIGFTNLDVDFPVELKHGKSEFVWLSPTSNVHQATHANQHFEFRNSDGQHVASVTLVDVKDEL